MKAKCEFHGDVFLLQTPDELFVTRTHQGGYWMYEAYTWDEANKIELLILSEEDAQNFISTPYKIYCGNVGKKYRVNELKPVKFVMTLSQ